MGSPGWYNGGMELEQLKELPRGSIKELWRRNLSPEVEEAWENARGVLKDIGEKNTRGSFTIPNHNIVGG